MGKQNKQRRAAKARERARRRVTPGPRNHRTEDDPFAEQQAELERSVARLWNLGWQPAELIRQVQRTEVCRGATEVLRHAIAVDDARRDRATLHPAWAAQIDQLHLPTIDPSGRWLARLCRERRGSTEAVRSLAVLLSVFRPLARLIPPPGGSASDVDVECVASASIDVSDPVLQRVRALLAKAEATPYPAEAEAFTAKAHELMTRHAIDAALVDADSSRAGWSAIRVPIDDPYLHAKALLLHTVAEHTRCRAVSHDAYALCTVVGHVDDLAAVQVLFTSLLLQAQQAVLAEGADAAAGAQERSRGYRSSFLKAYAWRIGERLAEVSANVTVDAQRSSATDVLPVLADRRRVVDEAVDKLFGELRTVSSRGGWDPEGWQSGRRAANRARLSESGVMPGASASLGPANRALHPAS